MTKAGLVAATALWGLVQSPLALAQFKIAESFTGATAPGWTLSDDAVLTAPGVDPAGSGWLRLTSTGTFQKGTALYTAGSFAPSQSFVVRFRYASWGGNGADGLSFFLFDPSLGMANNQTGGGLGYCGGDGGFLAVGLDELGNFSNSANVCAAAGGGPGPTPQSLVLRGPISDNNQWITGIPVPGDIDVPLVIARPAPRTVSIILTPSTPGYLVTVRYQDSPASAEQTLLTNVAVPYVAPPLLSIGFSGSTGALTNAHEIQSFAIAAVNDIAVSMAAPASVVAGSALTYTVTVTNNGPVAINGVNTPTLGSTFAGALTGVTWTCAAGPGSSCTSAGTGNTDTATMALPVGGSATFQVTGIVGAATACGAGSPALVNGASADFGATAGFIDISSGDNSASASTAVACADTVPDAFSFAPATGVATSSVQTSALVTLSGLTGTTSISVTSGCLYSVNGGAFVATAGTVPPGATVAVRQTAAATGLTSSTCTLTVGGVSAPYTVTTAPDAVTVPGPFAFTPTTGVAPSSVQTSGAVTLTGLTGSAPISVTSGCQYSVNGGPFVATAGTVPPGATVAVRQTAAATGLTSSTCTLTVGGISAAYSVTTAAVAGALAFTSATYSANGANPTATVSVTRAGGSNGPASVDILNTAGAVLGTARFADGATGPVDVSIPLPNLAGGGSLPVRLAAPAGGASLGQIANATITVAAAPLGRVVIESRGGGGAMSLPMLLALAAFVGWARLRRRQALMGPVALALLCLHIGLPGKALAADDAGSVDTGPYVGLRAGGSISSLTSGSVTDYLQDRGFNVTADTSRTAPAGTAFIGYGITPRWAIEAGYSFIGRTRSVISGTTPPDLQALFLSGVDGKLGAGEAGLLNLRYRWPFSTRTGLDFRAGGYQGRNRSTIYVNDVNRFRTTDDISGAMIGAGLWRRVGEHWGLSLGVEQFRSSSRNRFTQALLGVEYRFRGAATPVAAPIMAPVTPPPPPPPAEVAPPPVAPPPPAPLDSDADGIVDASDRCPGTPRGAAVDATGCETAEFVLRGVNFATDSAVLLAESTTILDEVVRTLQQRPGRLAEIHGHTDSTGKANHNQKLSEQRARAVVDYLVKAGIPSSQLSSQGFGATQPIATNGTPAGRAENRRVSIAFAKPAGTP